jgi:hypothetical protein
VFDLPYFNPAFGINIDQCRGRSAIELELQLLAGLFEIVLQRRSELQPGIDFLALPFRMFARRPRFCHDFQRSLNDEIGTFHLHASVCSLYVLIKATLCQPLPDLPLYADGGAPECPV